MKKKINKEDVYFKKFLKLLIKAGLPVTLNMSKNKVIEILFQEIKKINESIDIEKRKDMWKRWFAHKSNRQRTIERDE